MKKLIYISILLIICWSGCKKDNSNSPGYNTSGVSIYILKGDNQKDTVGNLLKTPVIVEVVRNGAAAQNYIVQFKRSGCQDIDIQEDTTSSTGRAQYSWYLSGDNNTQSLNIVVLDKNRKPLDSTLAKAVAVPGLHGWHRSACIQNFPVNSLATLSSGRLVTSLNGAAYPYYSDNNAVTWHPFKSFSNNYAITKIIAPGTNNELFLATQLSGVFYSPDGGHSWVNRTSGITDPTNFSDMTYTKKGRLIFCSGMGVYISDDKGLTWTDVSFGLPFGASSYPCEQLNGDLYIIGSDAELYKSSNEGTTWINQGNNTANYFLATVESVYIDDSGNMFVGSPHDGADANGEIYKSADKGNTWIKVFSQPGSNSSFPNVTQINEFNGNYYFSFAGRGVFTTVDFSTYNNNTSRFAGYGLLSYTVANNAAFVIGSPGFGVFYYLK